MAIPFLGLRLLRSAIAQASTSATNDKYRSTGPRLAGGVRRRPTAGRRRVAAEMTKPDHGVRVQAAVCFQLAADLLPAPGPRPGGMSSADLAKLRNPVGGFH